jgi:hypothetical protein
MSQARACRESVALQDKMRVITREDRLKAFEESGEVRAEKMAERFMNPESMNSFSSQEIYEYQFRFFYSGFAIAVSRSKSLVALHGRPP